MINLNENTQLDPVTLESHSKLIKLVKRVYPPAYKHLWKNEDSSFYINNFYNPLQLQKELLVKDAEYYFIIYKNEPVGILRILFNKPFNTIKKATYINRIYLGNEAQGKGVAKAIFEWIEMKALENKNNLLWLKAMNTQEQALKFYTKQHFKIKGKTSLDFELMHEELRGMIIMTKEL
ncbi:GNAT family N-acetyltransferase [Lacinutrix jangbogonensis]|uniref:GNAT family N-acetyltransferase n=1 Tax=Lacinutrix jangbogonensis TaxID=1469557 RepID=UPI00069200EF|nr:GNAT family N-acetyltransferase [Lacinutrix jangbogonensis]